MNKAIKEDLLNQLNEVWEAYQESKNAAWNDGMSLGAQFRNRDEDFEKAKKANDYFIKKYVHLERSIKEL